MMPTPIPVLLYHGVDHDPPAGLARYTMHPDRFAHHMEALAHRGAITMTVSQLVDLVAAGHPVPERTVLVTFDDGMADFGRHAWPVLRDLGMAATLYVVTGAIGGRADWLAPLGGRPPMLDADQLRALDEEGCEIGAHSATHPQLDTIPVARFADEVRGARTQLSMLLGHPVRSFAYPHGYHDRRVKEAVRAAGFDSACAVRNMLSSTADDRFAIARVTVDADWSVDRLLRAVDGHGLAVAPRPEQLRTAGWRAYRRARTLVGAKR